MILSMNFFKSVASQAWEGTKTVLQGGKELVIHGAQRVGDGIVLAGDEIRNIKAIQDEEVMSAKQQIKELTVISKQIMTYFKPLQKTLTQFAESFAAPMELIAEAFDPSETQIYNQTQATLEKVRNAQAQLQNLSKVLFSEAVLGPYSALLSDAQLQKRKYGKLLKKFDIKEAEHKALEKGVEGAQERYTEAESSYQRSKEKYQRKTAQMVENFRSGQKKSYNAFLQYYNEIIDIGDDIFATLPEQ